jgi:hypothetical protein
MDGDPLTGYDVLSSTRTEAMKKPSRQVVQTLESATP